MDKWGIIVWIPEQGILISEEKRALPIQKRDVMGTAALCSLCLSNWQGALLHEKCHFLGNEWNQRKTQVHALLLESTQTKQATKPPVNLNITV